MSLRSATAFIWPGYPDQNKAYWSGEGVPPALTRAEPSTREKAAAS
ncbi:MAG: hypothetical protein QOH87_660 [Trebonia sp.]|nr:hypothetical protein [Trebonia sp.]